MVLYVDTQDIDLYPGTVYRVAVDNEQIVPVGEEGDEKFVVNIGTSAYSDNVLRTAIQDTYIIDFIAGWSKSSGFAGVGGGFALDATHTNLKVKLDATISGSDGNGYYEITLDYNTDLSVVSGDVVAADMEDKIRGLSLETGDAGFQLAYTNCSVEYTDGKFWIVSGTIARYYTGANRSSVKVLPGDTNDCSVELGFDLPVDSQTISIQTVPEALVKANYTAYSDTLNIAAGTGITAGQAVMITDGTNTDYFTALTVSGGAVAGTTDVTVAISGTNAFAGIVNDYTADTSKVQILKAQDPDPQPNSWFSNVDDVIRFGLKTIINQIDYSS